MAGPNDITSNPYDAYTTAYRVRPVIATGNMLWAPVYFNLGTASIDAADPTWWTISCPDTTHTILTFHPQFSFYIEGGKLDFWEAPETFGIIKANVVVAPDIPEQYGGNVAFAKNQKIKPGKEFELYSSAAFLAYNEEMPTNNVRLTIVHEATDNHEMEFVLKIHR
jgi:hypothetical protein